MNNNRPIGSFTLVGSILLFVIYAFLAYWYVSVAERKNIEKVEEHTVVIAHDLWALNTSGMFAYLELVAKTDHYKNLNIQLDEETVFLSITGPDIGITDAILFRLGLIGEKEVRQPIIFNKKEIGQLEGVFYTRYVYPLFGIFLGLFFFALTVVFIFYLVFSRRFLEKQVQERTRKYVDLVNLLPEMVIETDSDGWITFANKRAMECFHFSDFTRFKQNFGDFLFFESFKSVTFNYLLQTARSDYEKLEFQAKDSSGQLVPVLIRFAPIVSDNKITGARMIIVDVTERKNLLEQLNLDQKMKSIGMMASGIAHDLNNILSGIINYPELLLRQVPADSPLVKQIAPMKNAGLQAAAVVADLLTVARGVAATKSPIILNDIVEEYRLSPEFNELKQRHGEVSYSFQLAEDLHYTLCSSIHVRKSLMNLITNSSEAIDGSGDIFVTTENTLLETPLVTEYGVIQPGSYVQLSVQDTGKGISSEIISHVFEPFFSKKELGRSGTGLGLVVVLNTMQDHKGGVNVTSNSGGTTFELYFPRSLEKSENQTETEDIDRLKGREQKILVVDDEPRQRDIATQLLESLNYRVTNVASGHAAVDYLRQNKVDLVLLDMIMEPEMSGLKTYEEIIKIHPQQKAMIVSGFSENADVKEALSIGVSGLINKPYTREDLAKAVYDQLNA